ncbi:Metallo-hydrolase/oxidoreductase [Trametes gibbosa]|nr:Metallo-hydrolase/oxidoreductase [Trametes gibbosa]
MAVLTSRDLPSPAPNQAYCKASALEGGFIQIPLVWVIDTAEEGDTDVLPVLAFLLRHSTNGDVLVFDLGIRKDVEALPTAYHGRINSMGFRTDVPEDVADSLAKGGLAPADIKTVCYSHLHYDHIGDSRPYVSATFVVGGAAQPLVQHGWPEDPTSLFPQDLLPKGRTRFLDDPAGWPPLGPFPHAMDFYGDGSLYIVDAPGHMPGHVNILARTSSDGGWIFLAGDSAHDRRLLTGEAGIPSHGLLGCAHGDKALAAEHIARMRALEEGYPRVRVLLAHDVPWYEVNKGGPAFWPGVIASL